MADSPQELRAAREKACADDARHEWAEEAQRLKNYFLYMLMNNDGIRFAHCPRLIAAELKRLYPNEGSKK